VTEKAARATTSPKTFRVQGIPAEYGLDAVGDLLKGVVGLNEHESDIEVGSLALDVERRNEKVATISSSRLEAFLGPGDRWQKALPISTKSNVSAGRRHIILDTGFYSLTTLAAPEDNHLFE
jgi:hypothetical protein